MIPNKVQPVCLAVLGFSVSMLATGCVSTMGVARLTQVYDLPCFSIEDTAANRRDPPLLRAIGVDDIEQVPAKQVWGFTIPESSRSTLQSGACVLYGQLPSGAKETFPATPLKIGIVYSAGVNALATSASGRIFMHTVKFCLRKDATGKTLVHEVQWDDKAARWRNDACKQ